jgi:hypothetical protein
MSRLKPEKLHVRYVTGTQPDSPLVPRCYTLTHSDATGDLYLTIGAEHDTRQISGWYTRLMRDEVLSEWHQDSEGAALRVHCHVSGGLVLGSTAWRDAIFRRELPLVLEAFRAGDEELFLSSPELNSAPIWVHFAAREPRFRRIEAWGVLDDYRS